MLTINQGGDMKFSRLVYMMFFVVLATQLPAQIVQQIPNGGSVNWQDQMLFATGIGSPNPQVPLAAQRAGAIRAAQMDALRQILETVKGMNFKHQVLRQFLPWPASLRRNFFLVPVRPRYSSTGRR